MHLCQRFSQSSKHLLNSTSGIAFKAFFDSAFISSIVLKRCPRIGLLSLENSQKSHRAKSGEYGSFGTICVEFLAKWSRRMSAAWDGALSWCKNRELSAKNIFWNGVEWSTWNAISVSMVSNCHSTIFVHFFFDLIDVLMVVRGVPSHQHVLCLLWSLCTTYKHFSATWSNHLRLSATFWTFPQLKLHSANKI